MTFFFQALFYTIWSILWPLRTLSHILRHIAYVCIGGPLIKYPVYPKAFSYGFEGTKSTQQIEEDRALYFKHFVDGQVKPFDIMLPSHVTLRGIQYCPQGRNFDDGFIWFEGTNSSLVQNHFSTIKALGDKLQRPVISVEHRGIGWSGDSFVHYKIEDVVTDLVYSLMDSIDQFKPTKASASDYAKKVMVFGHSLGGGLGIAAAHRLRQHALPIKAFSWASYSSLSAVPKALFGRLLLILMLFIGLMWPLFHMAALTLLWQSFSYTVAGVLGAALCAYIIGTRAPNFFVTIIEWLLIRPMMILTGWQLDIIDQAKTLFDHNQLAFGHIMRAPKDLRSQSDSKVVSLLSRSGEDGFIFPEASLTRAMEVHTRQKIRVSPQTAEFLKGAYSVNNTGVHCGAVYSHILGPELAVTQDFKPVIDRIKGFYESKEYCSFS